AGWEPIEVVSCATRFRGLGGGISQQKVGVEPAGPHPRRAEPTVDRNQRGGNELRRGGLLDRGVPVRPLRVPFGANETLGKRTLGRRAKGALERFGSLGRIAKDAG